MAKTVSGLFLPLHMQAFSRAAHTLGTQHGQSIRSLHNSEPEPLAPQEFAKLTGQSLGQSIQHISLGYTPDCGTDTLRETVAKATPNTQPKDVITTAGAQEALTIILHSLLHTGDKVVVVTPVFEPIKRLLDRLATVLHLVELESLDGHWRLNLEKLLTALDNKCKALVVNFPNNPTGHNLSAEQWQTIIDHCRKQGIWLISDEVFRGIEQSPQSRLPAAASAYERGISVGVTAKSLALPGVRVGWLICADKQLRHDIISVKQYLSVCNSQLDEAVATIAVNRAAPIWRRNRRIVAHNCMAFGQQLDEAFAHQPRHKPVFYPPAGGHTGFVQFTRSHRGSQTDPGTDFCLFLAKTTGLLCYPGRLFGTSVPGFRLGLGYRRFEDDYPLLVHSLSQWLND